MGASIAHERVAGEAAGHEDAEEALFAAARARAEAVIAWAGSGQSLALEHGQLEGETMKAGFEFMRLLTQAHLNLRAVRERRRDQVKLADQAVAKLDQQIAVMACRWQRELDLLLSIPGFGVVIAAVWLAEIGPAPHLWSGSHGKLASWVTSCPGNHISARKRKHGKTGDAGTCIKPALIEAAWGAIRTKGRLQSRYNRLVRRFGGPKNPGAKKKAITAIAHTLLKIAYQVLRSGQPYTDPGADFYTRRESPARQQAWLERRLQQLYPGRTVTVTIGPPPDSNPPPGAPAQAALPGHH